MALRGGWWRFRGLWGEGGGAVEGVMRWVWGWVPSGLCLGRIGCWEVEWDYGDEVVEGVDSSTLRS